MDTPIPLVDGAERVRIELFGVARLTAGKRILDLPHAEAGTLAEAVVALAVRIPALLGPVIDPVTHRLLDGYVLNLNGRDFILDHSRPLAPGDTLLLVASAAGG